MAEQTDKKDDKVPETGFHPEGVIIPDDGEPVEQAAAPVEAKVELKPDLEVEKVVELPKVEAPSAEAPKSEPIETPTTVESKELTADLPSLHPKKEEQPAAETAEPEHIGPSNDEKKAAINHLLVEHADDKFINDAASEQQAIIDFAESE